MRDGRKSKITATTVNHFYCQCGKYEAPNVRKPCITIKTLTMCFVQRKICLIESFRMHIIRIRMRLQNWIVPRHRGREILSRILELKTIYFVCCYLPLPPHTFVTFYIQLRTHQSNGIETMAGKVDTPKRRAVRRHVYTHVSASWYNVHLFESMVNMCWLKCWTPSQSYFVSNRNFHILLTLHQNTYTCNLELAHTIIFAGIEVRVEWVWVSSVMMISFLRHETLYIQPSVCLLYDIREKERYKVDEGLNPFPLYVPNRKPFEIFHLEYRYILPDSCFRVFHFFSSLFLFAIFISSF